MKVSTGLLTGHCRLRELLGKLGIVSNEQCKCCELNRQTTEHLLTVCPALAIKRNVSLGKNFIEINEIRSTSPLRVIGLDKELHGQQGVQ